ncbi:Uncharacterised protein [Burkholderia cepacia]|nr:hypothetical protein DM41_4568 [Burkholderia cepacia ATCC 25416]SPV18814.1 Uncharacterised protein [Burkholderia cepacia]
MPGPFRAIRLRRATVATGTPPCSIILPGFHAPARTPLTAHRSHFVAHIALSTSAKNAW